MSFIILMVYICLYATFSKYKSDSINYYGKKRIWSTVIILLSIVCAFLPIWISIGAGIVLTFGIVILNILNRSTLDQKVEINNKLYEIIKANKTLAPVYPTDEDFSQNVEVNTNSVGSLKDFTLNGIPASFSEEQGYTLTNFLNKIWDDYDWDYNLDLKNNSVTFTSKPKPPSIAYYPGGEKHPYNFVPLGLCADGEMGWNISASTSNLGESSYIYGTGANGKIDPDMKANPQKYGIGDGLVGETPSVIKSPTVPHALIVGSTGGGKSVVLQNIIEHALTHENKINVIAVDLKQTEFVQYQGVKGVLAVANTIPIANELIRTARDLMYTRNRQMTHGGPGGSTLKKIGDYQPQDPDGTCWISGRNFKDNQKLKVKINGEEKEMTALEIVQYIHNNPYKA